MGPTLSASYFQWAFSKKRPNLANGGLRLPHEADGLCQFGPPSTFSECEAVTLRRTADAGLSDSKKIATKLHSNVGHASAHQSKRVSVDSDGGTAGLLRYLDSTRIW